MKMNNLKIIIFALLSIIILSSCTDEKIDPEVQIPVQAANPVVVDPNNPANPINGELFFTNPSNDFFPMAVMNNWNYETKDNTNQLKIELQKTIAAINYFKINQPLISTKGIGEFANADISCYIRKLSGDYFQRINIDRPEVYTAAEGNIAGFSVKPRIVIQPFEVKFFKESVAVGQDYTEMVLLDINESKTVSRIVNGQLETRVQHQTVYKELKYKIEVLEKKENQFVNKYRTTIIKTKLTNNLNNDVTYYWFAKNIGLIRQSNENGSDVVLDFLEIKTFNFF